MSESASTPPAETATPTASRAVDLFSPVRVAYSLEEIRAKLTPWMVAEFGHPKELDPDERDRWHERNGLIHHFLICHFPDADGNLFGENDRDHGRRTVDPDQTGG